MHNFKIQIFSICNIWCHINSPTPIKWSPWGKLEVNRNWCTLNIFHHQVNFPVNMVSLRGKHDKHVFDVFITCHLLFWTIICHCLIENEVSKFWAADQTTKRWLQPLNRGDQLIRVLFAVNTGNNFRTLITGCLIRGGCLMEVGLCYF